VVKLGVLMSVYKSDDPALFQCAVDSVLTQKFTSPVEVRIYLGVDGPVPEHLRTVIESYSSEIYKLFWFERNRGLACVLNELIHAREDETFFFRMDADDASEPERFQRQIAHMQAHPYVDILGTDILEVDDTTGMEQRVCFAKSPEDARSQIVRHVPVAHPSVCFRATVFEKVSEYPLVHLNEDIAMWFQCMTAGLVFDNLHEPLYRFRIGHEFWRRRSVVKALNEFKVYTIGIWNLEKITWKYIYPVARLMMRLAPAPLQKMAYSSSLRHAKPRI
jgi:glycosyltransferase involved in cell wall biosynthesis